MDTERRVRLVATAQHAAKLAVSLAMETARFVENESDFRKQQVGFHLREMQAELSLLAAHLDGKPERVPLAPARLAAE